MIYGATMPYEGEINMSNYAPPGAFKLEDGSYYVPPQSEISSEGRIYADYNEFKENLTQLNERVSQLQTVSSLNYLSVIDLILIIVLFVFLLRSKKKSAG
jgi:hypothetical protein